MQFAGITDPGRIRENNEDYYLLPEPNRHSGVTPEAIDRMGHLFLLCDGVGGHAAGEIASRRACEFIQHAYYAASPQEEVTPLLYRLATEAHNILHDYGDEHPESFGLSTTLVMLLFREGAVYYLTAGDSRAYRIEHGSATQVNPDHSVIWPLYVSGELTKDDLRSHPRNHLITSALGLARELTIFQANEPLHPGAVYLLCSDGLSDLLSDAEIAFTASLALPLQQRLEHLVAMANHASGKDNITGIIVES